MLAREIQSVFNGPRDPLRRIQRAGRYVAVCASRVFVGVPVMCVPAQEQFLEVRERKLEYFCEGCEALIKQSAPIAARCYQALHVTAFGLPAHAVSMGVRWGIGVHQVGGNSDGLNRKLNRSSCRSRPRRDGSHQNFLRNIKITRTAAPMVS